MTKRTVSPRGGPSLVTIQFAQVRERAADGFGRSRGQTEFYRGAEYKTSEVPKIRIDVAVPSGLAEAVVDAIQKIAGSGKIGDGKIFVSGLTEVVRIRTGERDQKALD